MGCLILTALAATVRPALAQEAAAQPRFDILEYEITGNTVLAVAVVEAAVTPFLGPGRSVADAELARLALEKAYQAAGYLSVLVDIPEQRVDEGIVRLSVTEGRVERLAVTGARYFDQGFIRRGLPALAPGSVPNFNDLQQQLATLGREERQLQPVLRPGRAPGTVEAEVQVKDRLPLAASVELNNNHAADTDALRLQASVRYDNLFQREHSLQLMWITAPRKPQQSRVFSANYSAPLAPDWSLLAYGLWSDSVVEPLGVATVVGQGTTLGMRAIRQFSADEGSHTLAFGADLKHLRERLTAGDDSLSTPLRYLPFQIAYTGSWADPRQFTAINSQLVFAQRSVLARNVACPGTLGEADQFSCKREGGDGSFVSWRAELRHTAPVPLISSMLPGTVSLRLAGQLATQPLVSAEQYAIGGADTVRGYYESEGSGDRGVLGNVEYRSANLWPQQGDAPASFGIVDLALLVFADVARVWVEQPSVGQASRISLWSSGLGLRLRATRWLSADADIAWPQKATARTREGDPRLHIRLRAQF